MIKKNNVLWFIFVILIMQFAGGCIKDKPTAPFTATTENNAKLLFYIEEEGDKINNILPPAINVQEVFNNLNSYLIIDVRENSDFLNGHIPGARNIGNDSLFNYIKTNHINYNKVVLVSASGQSAAYYSALLILAGFSNVYYMNFGIASWNLFFSSVWTDRLRIEPDSTIISYTVYQKNAYTSLPAISLTRAGESMEDFVQERINALIKKGFNENYDLIYSESAMTLEYWLESKEHIYTICTLPFLLYTSAVTYHLTGAVLYLVPPDLSDLRSISNLQTLPPYKEIAVYSGSGQESAYYTAYLRLLGYDAKSLLFGMNNIDYNMLSHAGQGYAFKIDSTINYPYVTGPSGVPLYYPKVDQQRQKIHLDKRNEIKIAE
jgi:rhodanese-related sulfurtransferase